MEGCVMGKNQYVSPRGNKWVAQGEGNKRATRVVSTQKAAIEMQLRLPRIKVQNLRFKVKMVEYAISVAMAMIHIHPKGKCKEGVGYQPAPSVYVADY